MNPNRLSQITLIYVVCRVSKLIDNIDTQSIYHSIYCRAINTEAEF